MRWYLISLAAALITVTSTQFLTIDTAVIVQPSETATFKPVDHNDTDSDEGGRDYSSSHNSTTYDAPPPNSGALSSDSSPSDDGEGTLDPHNVSSESDPDSRSIRDTSHQSNSKEPPKSSEQKSHEKSKTEEIGSHEPSKSSENMLPDNPNSTERSSHVNPSSNEDLSKQSESEKAGSDEVSSGEKSESSASAQRSREGNEPVGSEPFDTIDEQLIQTTHGPVKGHTWHETSEIMAFIDIPYGKFNGSFEAPFTAQSWIDVHDVKEHTKRCPQLQNEEYIGDIDCLTLSIFTLKNTENASVLFHIHDGYSNSTSGDPSIYGPDYLVPKDVILILPNYRLGPMGFLCMQNETAPGNAGLKDLSLALEWVMENIHLFGGNRGNIVVSGDGAAGAYAGYLALVSRSKSYVNKVITESGSALSHWALDRDPVGTAYKLANIIRSNYTEGILYNNTFEDMDLETIITAAKGMRFNPCIELDLEPFMKATPWKMLQDREIDTTFMIGSAIYAGTHEAVGMTPEFVEQLNTNFGNFLPRDLIFNNDDERKEFAEQLKAQYFKEENITTDHVQELSLWYTDASYLGPGIRLARPLVTAGATVYLYEFAYVGSLNRELEALNRPVPGAVRSDIVGYLFHEDGVTVDENSPDQRMINLMVDLWVSFINTGKPGADNVEWNELKKAEYSDEEWLIINSEPAPVKGIHVDRMRLWTSLYDEHFIEHNSALRYQPQYCLATIAALVCWMANKFNYSSH